MGLHDREYFRTDEYGGFTGFRLRSAVMVLIIINVVLWFFQVLGVRIDFLRVPFDYLHASASTVFDQFQVWRLLTANFLHARDQILHILFNMLFLFICGRSLEQMYGARRFVTFYLMAGVFAMLLQTGVDRFFMNSSVDVVGASGAVLAVVVLFTCLDPNRQILLFLFYPIKIWILCAVYVGFQLIAALLSLAGSSPDDTTAHWAHIGGAAFGGLFYLRGRQQPRSRPRRVRRRGFVHALVTGLKESFTKKKGPGEVVPFPTESVDEPTGSAYSEANAEVAAVSARIDELLDKIHSEGQESLSEEELKFLRENSQVYRSRR